MELRGLVGAELAEPVGAKGTKDAGAAQHHKPAHRAPCPNLVHWSQQAYQDDTRTQRLVEADTAVVQKVVVEARRSNCSDMHRQRRAGEAGRRGMMTAGADRSVVREIVRNLGLVRCGRLIDRASAARSLLGRPWLEGARSVRRGQER